ncbi:MAG: hypothetical protein LUQ66_00405 [Methanoregula sp.]|nr:hypothetical protein [Methanoregula sp.]
MPGSFCSSAPTKPYLRAIRGTQQVSQNRTTVMENTVRACSKGSGKLQASRVVVMIHHTASVEPVPRTALCCPVPAEVLAGCSGFRRRGSGTPARPVSY